MHDERGIHHQTIVDMSLVLVNVEARLREEEHERHQLEDALELQSKRLVDALSELASLGQKMPDYAEAFAPVYHGTESEGEGDE